MFGSSCEPNCLVLSEECIYDFMLEYLHIFIVAHNYSYKEMYRNVLPLVTTQELYLYLNNDYIVHLLIIARMEPSGADDSGQNKEVY